MWLKRIGMVLGCVLALIGGAVVGMTALAARVVPQQEALRVDRVMTVGELMPLRAIDRVLIIDVRGSGSSLPRPRTANWADDCSRWCAT